MSRPIVVPDISYIPQQRYSKLKGLLRYFEHRDGSLRISKRREPSADYRHTSWEDLGLVSDDDLPARTFDPRSGERWIDHGLGTHWREIVATCEGMEGGHILARSYVLSPDPLLIFEVEEGERLELLASASEDFVHALYREMDWGDPEFVFVMHDRQTNPQNPEGEDQPVMQMLHSHIITPGMHFGNFGRRESQPKFVSAEIVHEVAQGVFERHFERTLGFDRYWDLMFDRGAVEEIFLDDLPPDLTELKGQVDELETSSHLKVDDPTIVDNQTEVDEPPDMDIDFWSNYDIGI